MILKRILAYTIDYFVIIIHAALLFLFTYSIYQILDKPLEPHGPITGNIISFITLTLPVFLYFYFFESIHSFHSHSTGKEKFSSPINFFNKQIVCTESKWVKSTFNPLFTILPY